MTADLATHPTWMELDIQALAANLDRVRSCIADGVMVIASVKANAYGHGVVPVAEGLVAAGVDMLATGSFESALEIRRAGAGAPILMLAGSLPCGLAELRRHELIPTIYDQAGAEAAAAIDESPTQVFVKIDVGLGRLGVPVERARAFVNQLAAMPGLDIDGIYTHLSFDDQCGMDWAAQRLPLFYELLTQLARDGIRPRVTQALASSALVVGWRDDSTAVCPGHCLYGLSPVAPELAGGAGYAPVLRAIKSRVIHIGDHAGGPPPGSGAYHARRQSRRTAVTPCGLNDGYRPAGIGQIAHVLCGGRRLPVIGVSLEHLTFDVPDDMTLELGAEVVLVGQQGSECITLQQLAAWQGASPLQVMMAFSGRIPV